MRVDEKIINAFLCLREQHGSFYAVARITGGAGDRAAIHQCLKNYEEWKSGKRPCQPKFGDSVWERFWKVLKPHLPSEYTPLAFLEGEPNAPRHPGIIDIFSQERMDQIATLLEAQNPICIAPNGKVREEYVGPDISFGFEAGRQQMEGCGIEDGDTIFCGPAMSSENAVPGSLVACCFAGRCLVRQLERLGNNITLFATNSRPLIARVSVSDIGWVAPVRKVQIDVELRFPRKYAPQRESASS